MSRKRKLKIFQFKKHLAHRWSEIECWNRLAYCIRAACTNYENIKFTDVAIFFAFDISHPVYNM